jgi:hypothetical protein
MVPCRPRRGGSVAPASARLFFLVFVILAERFRVSYPSSRSEIIGTGWAHRRTIQEIIDVSGDKDDNDAPRWPALTAAVQGAVGGRRPVDARSSCILSTTEIP